MDSLYHVVQFEQLWKDEMDRCEGVIARRLKTNPSGDVTMPEPHRRSVRQRIELGWARFARTSAAPRPVLTPGSSPTPEPEGTAISGADAR